MGARVCVKRGSGKNDLIRRKREWALTGSNRRHPACKAGALPAELSAPGVGGSMVCRGFPAGEAGTKKAGPAGPAFQSEAAVLVHSVLEGLAGLEAHGGAGGDFDILASARVAALAGRALGGAEGAEADEANFAALDLQRIFDRGEDRVDHFAGLGLRDVTGVSHHGHQILFIHSQPPWVTKRGGRFRPRKLARH